jgi:vitamin-K-epoxide reductase (warfarin-sensitive)
MKYILLVLALVGAVDSTLALHEHYRVGASPCSINEKWDCGIVNHSPYAVMGGVPVAAIGIAGYLLLGLLAFRRQYGLVLGAALPGLGFSLYLAHIEERVLGVWCVYCAISLGLICLLTILVTANVVHQALRRRRSESAIESPGRLSS